MTRHEIRRGVLFFLAVSVFLFASALRLDAFSVRLLFVDLNGDGRPEAVELFSGETKNSIAIHLSHSKDSEFHLDPNTLAFGTALAANLDHDGDWDLVWLSGGGPDSIATLHGDWQGNFEFVANSHFYLSELRPLTGCQLDRRREPEHSSLVACLSTFSDHSKDLTFATAAYVPGCIFRSFLAECADHNVRAPPPHRYAGRSPPTNLS